MPQQLLHGADVVPRFEKVRRERVTQRMRRRGLLDVRAANGVLHRALKCLVGKMVAPHHAVSRIDGTRAAREHVLPAPLPGRAGILAVEREGEPYLATAIREIAPMQLARVLDLRL
jgi:hypothetical protein